MHKLYFDTFVYPGSLSKLIPGLLGALKNQDIPGVPSRQLLCELTLLPF